MATTKAKKARKSPARKSSGAKKPAVRVVRARESTKALMQRMLVMENPQGGNAEAERRYALTEAMMTLKAQGRKVEDLDEDEWIEVLEGLGVDREQAIDMFEDVVQWGVDDG